MIERGQEPYIADEMKGYMELEGFQVVHCVKKHSYLGNDKQSLFIVFNVNMYTQQVDLII